MSMLAGEHKYIRHSTAGFIIWPVALGELWHKHVSYAFKHSEDLAAGNGKIVSAGMCTFTLGTKQFVECYGMSESLGIKSLPDDSAALRSQILNGLIVPPPAKPKIDADDGRDYK